MQLFKIKEGLEDCISNGKLDRNALDKLDLDTSSLIENLSLYVKNLKAELNALNEQKTVFIKRAKNTERKIEEVEQRISEILAGQSFSTTLVTVTPYERTVVVVDDPHLVPDYFFFPRKIDDEKVLTAIKSGKKIPGIHLEEADALKIN